MFYLIKHMLILIVGTGATQDWESCGMLTKTPVWNIPRVN